MDKHTVRDIRLEALSETHIPTIIEACQDWRELAQYGNPYWRPRSTAELRRKINSMSGPQPATEYNYVIVDQADGRMVGECSLHGIDWRNRHAQVGVCIWNPVNRGKGYGKAGVCALVDWATEFLGLRRLEAHILTFNTSSLRLFEGLGFSLEGTARAKLLIAGDYHDMHITALVA